MKITPVGPRRRQLHRKQQLPVRRLGRRRFHVLATLVCLPLLGTLFATAAIDAAVPATAAVSASKPVAPISATAATHKRHLTAAEKRAAAHRREAALRREAAARRRREKAKALLLEKKREAKKHAAAQAAPLAQSTSGNADADTNIAPNPDFVATCEPTDDSVNCITQEFEAIDNAQTQEGLQPTSIDIDAFTQLNPAEQMFVLTDLERVIRNLPPVVALTTQLDSVAQQGAVKMTDPALNGWVLTGGKGAIAWDSNWAGGLNTVGSDYFWLYSDGEGYNIDCTPTDQSGCWQHEENILAPITGTCGDQKTLPQMVMGAGATTTAEYGPSEAEIIVQECGGLPSDVVFTWSEAQEILGISAT
jgi:hypothetical protein